MTNNGSFGKFWSKIMNAYVGKQDASGALSFLALLLIIVIVFGLFFLEPPTGYATGTNDPEPPPIYCGNGEIDSGEQCDGGAIGTDHTSCDFYGDYISGNIGCNSNCDWDFSSCVSSSDNDVEDFDNENNEEPEAQVTSSYYSDNNQQQYELSSNDIEQSNEQEDIRLTCFDSDGGKNYFSFGSISSTELSKSDSCSGNKSLTEYSCDSDGRAAIETYDCPNICKSGACVEVQSSIQENSILLVNNKLISDSVRQQIQNIQSSTGSNGITSTSQDELSTIIERLICGDYSSVKPVRVVSSSSSQQGFPAENSIDGNINSIWYSTSSRSYPKTISFDLGQIKCIRSVDLYFDEWDIPVNVDIEVSKDGIVWDNVISNRNFVLSRNLDVNMPEIIITRYVRVSENFAARNYGTLSEIAVDAAEFRAG